MTKQEQAIGLVADYLSRHRAIPPEHEGWFSEYEIEAGVKEELGTRLRPSRVIGAVDFLMNLEPPALEDTWVLVGCDGNPILEAQYQHPEQPKGARRYYRALGKTADYAVVEAPGGNLYPA